MISLYTAENTRTEYTQHDQKPSRTTLRRTTCPNGTFLKASAHIFDEGLQKNKFLFCPSCLTFFIKTFWVLNLLPSCGRERNTSVQPGPSDTVCITGKRKTFHGEYSHQDGKGSSCRYVLLTELNTQLPIRTADRTKHAAADTYCWQN